MIYHAYLEDDGPDGMTLVLEGDMGSQHFPIGWEGLEALDKALDPFRMHKLEGEIVRREREAAGNVTWGEFRQAQARMDPEWAEELTAAVDWARKAAREGASCDPADETSAA